MNQNKRHSIVIVGGGAAGITTAALLRRRTKNVDITVIEPSEVHYYQPAFTLVGAGAYKLKNTIKPTAKLIPDGVKWLKDSAESFDPENNKVILSSGETLTYDYLVVCPGLVMAWDKIDGLEKALGTK